MNLIIKTKSAGRLNVDVKIRQVSERMPGSGQHYGVQSLASFNELGKQD